MTWDGVKRRAEDSGSELPEVILARIDERVKNINEKFEDHSKDFNEHKKDDLKNFAGLYKWLWIGTGAISCLQFLILAKH